VERGDPKFQNQVVLEGARSRNWMMKNQSTSWSASKTFLERLGRAWLIVRIARHWGSDKRDRRAAGEKG
jgi:hypothetical protein